MHKNQQLTSKQLLAEGYLKEIGFLNISTEDTVLTMKKTFIVGTKPTEIIISIGSTFPLEYPKFYTKDGSMFLIYPHVERKNKELDAHGICLFDEEDKLYYESHDYLLLDNLNRLEEFFLKIDNNEFSQNEIFAEFDSYWDSTGLVMHYNKDLLQECEDIKLLDIYVSNDIYRTNQQLLIVDTFKKVDKFFRVTKTPYVRTKVIYINFQNKFPSKIPTTYEEFLDAVKNAGYLDRFQSFKKNEKIYQAILFSFKLPSNEEHFAFVFIEPPKVKAGRGVKNINPISNMLSSINANIELKGGIAKDISSKRIYTRGGNNMNHSVNSENKKIAIVGCGSIGATLAYKLMKAGCSNLVLIDPDGLSVDNISRHLLGMEYVGYNKAFALNEYLEKQFLDTNINHIPETVASNFEVLSECDLIISALGSDAKIVETKLIKDSINGVLPPIISCWVEANAIAGHSILFDKNDTFEDIDKLFDSITILNSDFGKGLKKSDVGCSSSYMPYTFLNADMHTNHFANMIIQYILNGNKKYVSSIGDVSTVREHLKDDYKDVNSFSLIQKEFN